jgi:hypothetical protein
MNAYLPSNARVALMGDTRGYYLDRAYTWADWGHNIEFSGHYTSAEDFVGYLRSRGITHVMINFGFFAKRGKGAEPIYSAIDKDLLSQVYPAEGDRGRVAVYEVRQIVTLPHSPALERRGGSAPVAKALSNSRWVTCTQLDTHALVA